MRHFGNPMGGGTGPGGIGTDAPSRGDTLPQLPSASILPFPCATGATFKRSNLTQALFDILALAAIGCFILITALSIPFAVFMLLFVRI